MKKSIYYLMMLIGLAITGCEPMEDIHGELDEELANAPIVGVTEYVLTEEDYTALELEYGSFNSLDEAGALLPTLLAEQFPVWGEGSLAKVTFDLYDPIYPEDYAVTADGYTAIGLETDYFRDIEDIREFLAYQFPAASTNDYIELTYRTVAVAQDDTIDQDEVEYVAEELADVYPQPAQNAGQYGSFGRVEGTDIYWSDAMILEAINLVLNEDLEGVEGQTYEVFYPAFDGNNEVPESMVVRFDGTAYVPFGSEGEAYTLTTADYDLIAAELDEEYPDAAASAGEHDNFDAREEEAEFWSQDMIMEAINVVLDSAFSAAAEGDEFSVTYDTYLGDGIYEEVTQPVMLTDGIFVEDKTTPISTVMETSVFAFGDGAWHVPEILPEGIYTEQFDQEYSNFGSEADAGFYISRWLEPQYPYAQEGDFISVAYDIYDDGETVTRYASFIYEDNHWEFIPSTIPATLQFGFQDGAWVVDNTIIHTLLPADYEFIGEAFADIYPDPAWSVGNYLNFDRRDGNVNQWKDDMLLEAMRLLLNERIAPDAEEGQKFLLVFDVYNGTNTTEQLHLIKKDGVWVPVE